MAVLVARVGPLSRSGRNRPSGDCGHLRMLVEEQIAAQRAVEAEIRALLDAGHSWTENSNARYGLRPSSRRVGVSTPCSTGSAGMTSCGRRGDGCKAIVVRPGSTG
jgi:hypothetical protein